MANPFGKRPPIKDAQHYPNLFRSVRTRRNKFWGRWYSWVAIGLLVLLVGGAGFGVWYYYSLQGEVTEKIPDIVDAEDEEDYNVLLVGSDSREGLTEEEKVRLGAAHVGGERADTIIIAHIDPNTDHVTLVQFPRDLYITHADGTQDRINASLAKGRDFLIDTMREFTGLTFNVYAQVNIAGFKDVVDAIDGVKICLTEPVAYSSATGLEITDDEVPGMVYFDGDRAISFVRERKAFTEGDFTRVQNQQRFLAAAINKIMSAGTFLRFDRLLDLKKAAGNNFTMSDTVTLLEVRDLARQLSNVEPDRYEVYTAPNLGTGRVGDASVVLPDDPALEYLFAQIKKNEPPSQDGVPDIPPSEIAIGIYNGTGIDGAASEAEPQLIEATADDEGSIEVVEVADADRDDYGKSRIVYENGNADAEEKARFLAAALPKAKLEEGKTRKNVDVAVIVGEAFEPQRIVQVTPLDIPEPGEIPPECA